MLVELERIILLNHCPMEYKPRKSRQAEGKYEPGSRSRRLYSVQVGNQIRYRVTEAAVRRPENPVCFPAQLPTTLLGFLRRGTGAFVLKTCHDPSK